MISAGPYKKSVEEESELEDSVNRLGWCGCSLEYWQPLEYGRDKEKGSPLESPSARVAGGREQGTRGRGGAEQTSTRGTD